MRAIPRTLPAAGLAAMLYGTSGSAITLDEFVERHDLDGDGLLAVEEMTAGPLLDRNGDGFVDRDELAAVARRPRSFHWVNPLPAGETYPGVRHATFESHSMGIPVGYCIYLPPGYDDAEQAGRRYPWSTSSTAAAPATSGRRCAAASRKWCTKPSPAAR